MKISEELMNEMNLDYSKNMAKIIFSHKALVKMLWLVAGCDGEIGWHGFGRKIKKGTYKIDDISLYPQKTTAVTITTDDNDYAKWIQDMAIHNQRKFKNICLHGHSHVNMGVSPSGVDRGVQDDIIKMIPDDGFYIFMIMNKSLQFNMMVVDKEDNALYERIKIMSQDLSLPILRHEYKKYVKQSTIYKGEWNYGRK